MGNSHRGATMSALLAVTLPLLESFAGRYLPGGLLRADLSPALVVAGVVNKAGIMAASTEGSKCAAVPLPTCLPALSRALQ